MSKRKFENLRFSLRQWNELFPGGILIALLLLVIFSLFYVGVDGKKERVNVAATVNGDLLTTSELLHWMLLNKAAEDSLIISRDLRYAPQPDSLNGDTSSDKLLDLYFPATSGNKKPVLIFVHGGGFAGGDKQGKDRLCAKIASKGIAVISINYWLTRKHHEMPGSSATANMSKGVPASGKFHPGLQLAIQNASNDLILVLKWLKQNAESYNLDTSMVALSGGSAGAMTVLYTAYASGQNVLPIKAVVSLWGGLADVSVVKKGAPPVLIYHGGKDKTINVDFSHALKKRMDKIGNNRSILHIMEGKGHAQYRFIRKEKTKEITNFLSNIYN